MGACGCATNATLSSRERIHDAVRADVGDDRRGRGGAPEQQHELFGAERVVVERALEVIVRRLREMNSSADDARPGVPARDPGRRAPACGQYRAAVAAGGTVVACALMDAQTLALFPVWYAAFLLSLTCHEAGHALVARWGGDDTAYLSGQVSLNPWPHIRREPFGTVLVPILTYFMGTSRWMMGWASAPYDPRWEDRHPARAALMSAAGPAGELHPVRARVRASCGSGSRPACGAIPQDEITVDRLVAAAPGAAGLWDAAGRFLSVVMSLNLILGVFNLMPFPPLDGIGGRRRDWCPRCGRCISQWRAVPAIAIVGVILAWRVVAVRRRSRASRRGVRVLLGAEAINSARAPRRCARSSHPAGS